MSISHAELKISCQVPWIASINKKSIQGTAAAPH
jgi:hypothetical protein